MLYRKVGGRSGRCNSRKRSLKARKRPREAAGKHSLPRDTPQEEPDPEEEQWRAYAEECDIQEVSPGAQAAENTECDQHSLTAVQAAPGACVLAIPSEKKLTFTGKCRLTCLYGSVQVFGFTIHDGQPFYNLYSAHTLNALSIEAQPYAKPGKSRKEIRQEARAILREYLPLAGRRTLMSCFAPLCSFVLLESLEDATSGFILSHPEYAKIFTPKLNEKSACFSAEAALTCAGLTRLNKEFGHVMSESSAEATKELIQSCIEDDSCPIILVCGPKNVGKSTFTRHLMNRLLNHIPCVEYLECDVGQTEFTPPGCVSLLNVTEPLFGPPFSHQREPRRMVYYGEASCENDLERYIDTVKHVFSSYKRAAPLIINTLGWVKGFGFMLLIDLIRLLSPSHIVQIFVKDSEEMPPLNPQLIQEACGLHTKGKAQKKINVSVNAEDDESMEEDEDSLHFEIPEQQKLLCVCSEFAGAGDTNNMRCHNNILRDLAIIGYLSKLQPRDLEQPLPLNGLIPYQVPFNAVAVRIIHANVAPAQILYSINANWVGLCSILEDVQYQNEGPVLLAQTPVCDCFGFGIVRGVDTKKKVYHILTPVPPQSLRMVNCLILGSVTVPHSVLKNQPGIEGEVPYVTPDYSFEISGAGKIKVNKQRKRREHSWLSVSS